MLKYMFQSSWRKCDVVLVTDQIGILEIDSNDFVLFDQFFDFIQTHVVFAHARLLATDPTGVSG